MGLEYELPNEWTLQTIDECMSAKGLIHEVVQSIKRNLKVDWTEPHREDVKAAVRAAVRRVLTKHGVEKDDFDRLLPALMTQAEALYAKWPLAA